MTGITLFLVTIVDETFTENGALNVTKTRTAENGQSVTSFSSAEPVNGLWQCPREKKGPYMSVERCFAKHAQNTFFHLTRVGCQQ
jgi:hypothetical protein